MQRKVKLRIIQFSLLLIGIIIAFFTYLDSDRSSHRNKVLLETKKERTAEDQKNSSSDNINIFYNIKYSGLDLSGNRYILNSKEARTSASNPELINFLKWVAIFLLLRVITPPSALVIILFAWKLKTVSG